MKAKITKFAYDSLPFVISLASVLIGLAYASGRGSFRLLWFVVVAMLTCFVLGIVWGATEALVWKWRRRADWSKPCGCEYVVLRDGTSILNTCEEHDLD